MDKEDRSGDEHRFFFLNRVTRVLQVCSQEMQPENFDTWVVSSSLRSISPKSCGGRWGWPGAWTQTSSHLVCCLFHHMLLSSLSPAHRQPVRKSDLIRIISYVYSPSGTKWHAVKKKEKQTVTGGQQSSRPHARWACATEGVPRGLVLPSLGNASTWVLSELSFGS